MTVLSIQFFVGAVQFVFSLLFYNTVISHVGEVLEVEGVDIVVLVHKVLILATILI